MIALDTLKRDVRYGLRALRRTPGFTALAVLILALGIGANTAIFSLVSAVALAPLPFSEPDRLVLLWEDLRAVGGPDSVEASPANFADWRARSRSFEGVAGFANGSYNLTGDGEPERLSAARTTPNLFSVLGLQPLAGRTFAPGETVETTPVVVIGQSLWMRRFNADPGVVGRDVTLDGARYTVIGVVPPDFKTPSAVFTGEIDVWLPTEFSAEELSRRSGYYMYVVARLAQGVTREQAQAEMDSVASAMAEQFAENRASRVRVAPLHDHLSRDARPTLLILLGAVALLLLITCANVANLLLARGAGRARELAVRKALGATHGRVLRHLLTECAVLAGAGLALGTLLALFSSSYLARLVPLTFPASTMPSLDWRVLSFSGAVAVLTVLVAGVGPALVAARVSLRATLKQGVGRVPAARGRLGRTLVVAEIALTVVLLAAAGLLLRSYAQVLSADPGFRAENLLIATTVLPQQKYGDLAVRTAFYDRLLERIRTLPGVASAGYANYAPLTFKGGRVAVTIEGAPAPTPETLVDHLVSDRVATEGYLETLGVPLAAGRYFDSRDSADAPLAAVINLAMARKFWPDQDAVGKRFKFGPPTAPWITVVGVSGDVRQMGLDVAAEPELYLAARQTAAPPFFWPQHLLVRTQLDPLGLAAGIRAAVRDVDADQPVSSIRPMTEVLDAELVKRNTQLTLVAAFAVLALVLAAVGLYGVLAYSVAQRKAEIGLKMALGAQPSTVLRAVVGNALALAALGLVLGVGGALAATRVLESFLFGVSPTDPMTFAAAAALLLAVTGAAAYLPARRAARIDPMAALRDE